MTFLKYILVAALFLGVILSIPFFIQARDRAITVDSLEKAYASRVTYLEGEIASTTKSMEIERTKLVCPSKWGCHEYTSPRLAELHQEKNELEFELKSITPSYNLLVEALK